MRRREGMRREGGNEEWSDEGTRGHEVKHNESVEHDTREWQVGDEKDETEERVEIRGRGKGEGYPSTQTRTNRYGRTTHCYGRTRRGAEEGGTGESWNKGNKRKGNKTRGVGKGVVMGGLGKGHPSTQNRTEGSASRDGRRGTSEGGGERRSGETVTM